MDTMPERLVINGVTYVREDTVPKPSPSPRFERHYTVAEIEDLTGVNYQSVYRAVKRGELTAMYPNGSQRGMRFAESEVIDWMERRTHSSASCS